MTAACEQPSPHLPLAVDIIDCSEIVKRISQPTGVPVTIDKIVDLIATILVKFLILIVFVQKKSGGERNDMTTIKKKTVAQPSAPPSPNTDFTSATRDAVLNRVEQDYEEFKKTRTFRYPTWLYGPIKGRLFKVEVEDCPRFGDISLC